MREDLIEIEIGAFSKIQNGYAFKSKEYVDKGLRIIRIANVQSGEIIDRDPKFYPGSRLSEFKDYVIEEDDFLISLTGNVGRVGRIGKSLLPALLNQRVGKLNLQTNSIEKSYLYYFLNSRAFVHQVIKSSKGVGQLNTSSKKIEAIKIPIAPLSVQRAIVAKIEELFSDLDKGIADLKKAQDQLKVYRQAVLKKAFEGEFNQVKVIEIADVSTGATPKRGNLKYWGNGNIPWVTSGVVNNPFVNEPSEHITEIAIKETNCKIIEKGSLLVAMYGEGKTRGKCSELNIDAATNQALAAITLKEETQYSKEFVKWFFVKNYEEIRLLSSGGVQPNLNLALIKNTILPFPSEEVQHQIVQEIESRISVCDKVEENITESLEKAKALRQSVLKKAFEGTLLSEEEIAAYKAAPDYEPASVLLEKIKAEKKKK